MRNITPAQHFVWMMQNIQPTATAWIIGSRDYPNLSGLVKFYNTDYEGILITAEVFGLPNVSLPGSTDFYAMHIHEFGDCALPFNRTGSHYTRDNELHPNHTGDLLPLLGNQGYAWCAFYDKRFDIPEIIGRSVVIHSMSDDFHTQPAGNSGEKIGCGVIRQKQ